MSEDMIDRMRMSAGDLWGQATTHSSAGKENNQRLEFLGNGVLNLALADLLYHRFSEQGGHLTKLCNYLCSDDILNEVGRAIGLDSFLKFEMSTYYHPADSIVIAGMKAIIGAVHEKAGYDAARDLVKELVLTDDLLKRAQEFHDPITQLKEYLEGSPWKPRVTAFDGMVNRKRVFYHAIEFSGMSVMGMSSSKKKAEEQASRLMIREIERACMLAGQV